MTSTVEHEIPAGYEIWIWSTDARSLLLGKPGPDGRTFGVMAMPGGEIRPLHLTVTNITFEVAFVAGRQIVSYTPTFSREASVATQALTLTLADVDTGKTQVLPVVGPDRLRPGESTSAIFPLLHAGGSPPSIWIEIGRVDLLPTNAIEGSLTAPTVALLGTDVASGMPLARVEVPSLGVTEATLCRGVVADGVVLQRWTGTTTELIVVDPHTDAKPRVVTTFPGTVTVHIPGARH